MNHIAAMEEQLVSERLKQKLNEVNVAAQTQLSTIQDHVNFTLQVYMHIPVFEFLLLFFWEFLVDFVIYVCVFVKVSCIIYLCICVCVMTDGYGLHRITALSAAWF